MWFDKIAIDRLIMLRDKFRIEHFVETGTHLGMGTRLYTYYFGSVYSCDVNEKALNIALEKLKNVSRVTLYCASSPDFLAEIRRVYEQAKATDIVLFYLDAHWYTYWPLLDELKALKGFKNCCVVIHDFKVPGLAYDSYGGHDLELEYVKADLMAVNPSFYLYTNTPDTVHILTKEEAALTPGLVMDPDTVAALDLAWVTESNRNRGILYATPEPLDESFLVKEVKIGTRD